MKQKNCFFAGALSVLISITVSAAIPQWWAERNVTQEGFEASGTEENYTVANQGQLMHMAKQAAAELDSKSPEGAGTAIMSMVEAFHAYSKLNENATEESIEDNYTAVNLGQLKTVAKPFYDRLWEIENSWPLSVTWPMGITFEGGNGRYPWPDVTEQNKKDNYNLANIGQVKFLFSWEVSLSVYSDINGNGIDDRWELKHFGNLTSVTDTSDFDGDGIRDKDEYFFGTDPTIDDTDSSSKSKAARYFIYDNNSMIIGEGDKAIVRQSEGNITSFTPAK